MTTVAVEGGERLAAVGRELAAAGPKFRARLRRNVVAATSPIVQDAKQGFDGYGGLGQQLANATRSQVRSGGRNVGVSVMVDASRMEPSKQGLPPMVEGFGRWRHPLFGDREHWYDQAPRPELGPAVKRHIPEVQAGVIAAVEETAAALARGTA